MSFQWSMSRRAAAAALVSLCIVTCRGASTAPTVSATLLAFVGLPTAVTAGTTLPAIRIEARDNAGNVDAHFSGTVTLSLDANPSGGALDGTVTLNANDGTVEFTTLRIVKSGSSYTLRATSGALTGLSVAFDVTAGAASHLVFTTQPGNAAAGAPIAVMVTAQDSVGNLATGFSGATNSVTVAIGTNGGNPTPGTLSGTTTQTAANGVATFADLTLDKVGSNYTLTATGSGVTEATSASFAVSAGAAVQLVFTQQPVTTIEKQPITPCVQVMAQDIGGNGAADANQTITLALTPGTGALGAILSGTTGPVAVVAGVGAAQFCDLSINKDAPGYTLTASSANLPSVTSDPFVILETPPLGPRASGP